MEIGLIRMETAANFRQKVLINIFSELVLICLDV